MRTTARLRTNSRAHQHARCGLGNTNGAHVAHKGKKAYNQHRGIWSTPHDSLQVEIRRPESPGALLAPAGQWHAHRLLGRPLCRRFFFFCTLYLSLFTIVTDAYTTHKSGVSSFSVSHSNSGLGLGGEALFKGQLPSMNDMTGRRVGGQDHGARVDMDDDDIR